MSGSYGGCKERQDDKDCYRIRFHGVSNLVSWYLCHKNIKFCVLCFSFCLCLCVKEVKLL